MAFGLNINSHGSLSIYFAQGVTWVLVYRTEKYQKLKSEIEKQSKKLEKKKEAHGEAANLDRSKKRKLEAVSFYFEIGNLWFVSWEFGMSIDPIQVSISMEG